MFVSLCPRLFTGLWLEQLLLRIPQLLMFVCAKIINLHCWKKLIQFKAASQNCVRRKNVFLKVMLCPLGVIKFYVYPSVAWNQPVNIHSLVDNYSVRRVSNRDGNDRLHFKVMAPWIPAVHLWPLNCSYNYIIAFYLTVFQQIAFPRLTQ